jgi:hypothetical protein
MAAVGSFRFFIHKEDPMDWRTIMGVLLLVFLGFIIYAGRWPGTSHDPTGSQTTRGIYRAEQPFAFWSRVGMMLIVALALLFQLFPENLAGLGQ